MTQTTMREPLIGGVEELFTEFADQLAKRFATVLRARTMEALFGQTAQQMLAGEITDPNALLHGGGSVSRSEEPRRRLRRNSEGIDRDVAKIVAALKVQDKMRADELRAASQLSKADWLMPIKRALETGVITKTGHKRSTVYSLAHSRASEDSIPATRIAKDVKAAPTVIRRKKAK